MRPIFDALSLKEENLRQTEINYIKLRHIQTRQNPSNTEKQKKTNANWGNWDELRQFDINFITLRQADRNLIN